jgi:hypothetical protein
MSIKLFAIALSALLVMEAVFRAVEYINPALKPTTDLTHLRFRGLPSSKELNGFRLNSRGFKDIEYIKEKIIRSTAL